MVLRVEKKLFVIEQPIPLALPAYSKYLRSGMRFMMLIMRLLVLCSKYEKDLPKKAATPQVMAIQGGRIQKDNKKSLNGKAKGKGKSKGKDKSYIPKPKNPKPSAKEHPAKDDVCHHCKEVGHYRGIILLTLLTKHNLDSTYLWHCRLAHISKKRIEKLQHDVLLKSIDEESLDKYISCLSGKMTRKPFPHRTERVTDLLGIIHTDVCGPLRHVSRQDYALDTATRILNMVPTKKEYEALMKQDTPDKLQQRSVKYIFIGYPKEMMGYYFYFPPESKIIVARYAEFLEKNLLSQEVNGRAEELEEIQDKDTSPFENTSKIPIEVESFKPPQEEVVPIRRSARTHRAPDRLCLNVEVEEHSLGDLNEPTNYKAAMLDPKSNKWLDVMNAEMQSMKDNQVWRLVDLPPNCFVDPNHPRKVCKLQRSIYGLKQASRRWNKRFDEEIKKFGFAQNLDEIDTTKRGYIPMQERLDLNKTQGASTPEEVKRMQNTPYASVNPGKPHWTAVKTILKYLRNIKDMILVNDGNPEAELRVDCYCNAKFETNRDDIKSQT
ncbi:retrotransposon protein, putative, ty1-copia subclass [Tanacetum coccineum]